MERIAGGYSVNAACLAQGYRKSMVLASVVEDAEGVAEGKPWKGFSDRYMRARGVGIQTREDALGQSRDDDLNHRWYLERMDEDLRPPRQKLEHLGGMTVTDIIKAESEALTDFDEAKGTGGEAQPL